MKKLKKNLFKKHFNKFKYIAISKEMISFICPVHGNIKMETSKHLRSKYGCLLCSRIAVNKNKTIDTLRFIAKARLQHSDNYDYRDVDFKTMSTAVNIHCKIHGVFKQLPKNHLKGSGCHKCMYIKTHLAQRSNTNAFVTKAKKIHGSTYDYSQTVYITKAVKVKIICKKHGVFTQTPNNHISNSAGCPVCKSSKGEKKIYNLLTSLKIDFIREYRLDKFRFDFYLPRLNILLEYDGIQHFKPTTWLGESEFLNIQIRDKEKDDLAFINSKRLIRIGYNSYNNLEFTFFKKISKYYRYFYKGCFYKNISELFLKNDIPRTTLVRNFNSFKTNTGLSYRKV